MGSRCLPCSMRRHHKLLTYAGTQPEGLYKLSNSAENMVLKLEHPVVGTDRNITGVNWFTSLSLLTKLLQEEKLIYIGTIRKNRREISPQCLPHKKSSVFGFQEDCFKKVGGFVCRPCTTATQSTRKRAMTTNQ